MEVQDVIAQARDTLTVKRVFGEPYEKDGVTIIPAARIQGGAGGGSGEDPQRQGKGSGSGFGMTARPVGAFIIRNGEPELATGGGCQPDRPGRSGSGHRRLAHGPGHHQGSCQSQAIAEATTGL